MDNNIKWVHSPDCRSCVFDLENSSIRTIKRIIDDRKNLPKCNQCERLRQVIKDISNK